MAVRIEPRVGCQLTGANLEPQVPAVVCVVRREPTLANISGLLCELTNESEHRCPNFPDAATRPSPFQIKDETT